MSIDIEKVEALVQACFDGDLTLVKELLSTGVPIDAVGKNWNPLHAAIENYQIDVVIYLLQEGADPNFSCGDTMFSPLHHAIDIEIDGAIQEGSLDAPPATLTELLLAADADLDLRAYTGETALELAMSMGHRNAVKILKARGTGDPRVD